MSCWYACICISAGRWSCCVCVCVCVCVYAYTHVHQSLKLVLLPSGDASKRGLNSRQKRSLHQSKKRPSFIYGITLYKIIINLT